MRILTPFLLLLLTSFASATDAGRWEECQKISHTAGFESCLEDIPHEAVSESPTASEKVGMAVLGVVKVAAIGVGAVLAAGAALLTVGVLMGGGIGGGC